MVDDENHQPLPDKNCQVCAVGAVLRSAGFQNQEIDDFGELLCENGDVTPGDADTSEVIEELLGEGKYLHALSIRFEDQAIRTGTGKRTRGILTKFVKENFPKRIKLDPEL